ncbi:hypothetical protein QPK31_24025 [Massilia sp. YIM B02769]|uniref:hypothetical protein n=1 Tax=Massilia sp. YIM B02769 TaxID=3050129 RepID=UPI0025B6BEA9|nr:hypothetical protein [Massilia sp. YIM B02769]MDN4061292.1 hypothetical protein [Massilia sp. YIM B02769]
MATTTLMLKLKVRWWLKFYLVGVLLTARLTRAEPDWVRVRYWIGKGTKIEVR